MRPSYHPIGARARAVEKRAGAGETVIRCRSALKTHRPTAEAHEARDSFGARAIDAFRLALGDLGMPFISFIAVSGLIALGIALVVPELRGRAALLFLVLAILALTRVAFVFRRHASQLASLRRELDLEAVELGIERALASLRASSTRLLGVETPERDPPQGVALHAALRLALVLVIGTVPLVKLVATAGYLAVPEWLPTDHAWQAEMNFPRPPPSSAPAYFDGYPVPPEPLRRTLSGRLQQVQTRWHDSDRMLLLLELAGLSLLLLKTRRVRRDRSARARIIAESLPGSLMLGDGGRVERERVVGAHNRVVFERDDFALRLPEESRPLGIERRFVGATATGEPIPVLVHRRGHEFPSGEPLRVHEAALPPTATLLVGDADAIEAALTVRAFRRSDPLLFGIAILMVALQIAIFADVF